MKYPANKRFKSFQHLVDKIFNINLMLRPNIVKIIDWDKAYTHNSFKRKSGVCDHQRINTLKKPLAVIF